MVNFAEYISSVQKEIRKKKQASKRRKQESAKKNEKEIFELEEQDEKKKECSEFDAGGRRSECDRESISKDPFHDKNIKFDYSDQSAKFFDGELHKNSCFEGSESGTSTYQKSISVLKAENLGDTSFNGISITLPAVSQKSGNRNQNISSNMKTSEAKEEDYMMNEMSGVNFQFHETTPQTDQLKTKSIQSRIFVQHESDKSVPSYKGDLLMNVSTPNKVICSSRDLLKINVEPTDSKNRNKTKNINNENQDVFERFIGLDLNEDYLDEPQKHRQNNSALKMSGFMVEREIEGNRPQFRPLLTKKSLEIASKMGDPVDRLVNCVGEKKKQSEDVWNLKMSADCTFTPKINRKSRYLDERNMILKDRTGLSVSRHDKLYLKVVSYHIETRSKEESDG